MKTTIPTLVLLGVLAAPALPAAPVQVAGFTHVRSLGGFDEYRLEANGLQVLLKPDHSAPVVTFNVTYRVGSRNESTGTTGATHLLEHLMFKGTDAYNDGRGNSVKQFVGRIGASWNATTWFDRTNYFATLGKAHFEDYIAIEADRMRNLWLRESDRAAEMTVVRNEFERDENNPAGVLGKLVRASAFLAHPYRHATIGWRSDIELVPIGKLREFYDTFYWPNNATAVAVGDFDPEQALRAIQRHFGRISRSPGPIPEVYTEEPPQSGPRRVVLKRPGRLGSLNIAFKAPPATHEDTPALAVLDAILSRGKGSRFYRALVDKGLASAAQAHMQFNRDPTLFTIASALNGKATHDEVEQALWAEIERVKQDGVTDAEVAAALQQIRAATFFGRDGSARVVEELNECIAAGDWTLFVTHPEKISRVTAADVRRVAVRYLDRDQSTTGWYVPVATN